MRRLAALVLVTAAVAGCSSIGLGVTIPVGPVGVTIGGSVPLPPPPPPEAPASAPARK